MSTNVEIKIKPISVIETELGIEPNGKAHAYFTELCAEHMDKYIPYREGFLSQINRVINVDSIEYNSPYAHYMYEGKVMGPNIPIKDANGNIVRWFSKGPKYYTGADIDYSKSQAQAGHEFAGPYWDKRMVSAEKEELKEELSKYIKLHGGK